MASAQQLEKERKAQERAARLRAAEAAKQQVKK